MTHLRNITLFVLCLFLLCATQGCCYQKSSATFLNKQGKPITVQCESTTLLKDVKIVYLEDPNGIRIEVNGGVSSATDNIISALCGLGIGLWSK